MFTSQEIELRVFDTNVLSLQNNACIVKKLLMMIVFHTNVIPFVMHHFGIELF